MDGEILVYPKKVTLDGIICQWDNPDKFLYDSVIINDNHDHLMNLLNEYIKLMMLSQKIIKRNYRCLLRPCKLNRIYARPI